MLKKLLCVFMAVIFAFSVCLTGVGAGNEKLPVVIIPGIGQSNLLTCDENGNESYAFPLSVDVQKTLLAALKNGTAGYLKNRGSVLAELLAAAVIEIASPFTADKNGEFLSPLYAESYPYPYSEFSESERSFVNKNVPIAEAAQVVGEDYVYYFAYNFFASPYENARLLSEFLEMVKGETGKQKVNLLAGSQGATIITAYLDEYGGGEFNRVVYIVPALNGSVMATDFFEGRFDFSNESLYYDLFNYILDDDIAPVANVLLRFIPKAYLKKVLVSVVDRAIREVALGSGGLWSLVPSEDFERLSNKYISELEWSEVRNLASRYAKAQANLPNLIDEAREKHSVEFFSICGYGEPLLYLCQSVREYNSDQILNVDSASMGAICANLNETLPENYSQSNDFCQTPEEHNHISYDGVVDASSGFLCETTWFFSGQVHGLIPKNKEIVALTVNLLTSSEITSVYSSERFPQFSNAWHSIALRSRIEELEQAETQIAPELEEEYAKALENAKKTASNLSAPNDEIERAQAEAEAVLIKAGLRAEPEKDWLKGFVITAFSVCAEILHKLDVGSFY